MSDNLRSRPLRMAMIGGGPGSGIGEAHRMGARLDGQIVLVSGAFSSTAEKARQQGEALFLPPDRVHGNWRDLIADEQKRLPNERADFFSIVTPNHLHYEPTREALLAGFHVVMDKPMTMTADEARDLDRLAREKGRVLVLTHTYVGYPMVRLARDLIAEGRLGKIRKIHAEYFTGWLSSPVERENNKQASWRTDPALAGAGCLGDIGTHAAILAEMITGLRMEEIAAEVTTFVDGRGNDDNASMLVRWEGGAKGTICASEVAIGEENEVAIRVYGDKASLKWCHADHEHLIIRYPDRPMETWSKGWDYVAAASGAAKAATRMSSNQPEGVVAAFANLYGDAVRAIRAVADGASVDDCYDGYPSTHEGIRGMEFIEAALASARNNCAWTRVGK